MDSVASGVAALAVLAALVAVPLALSLHRRRVDEVITSGSARGRQGVAIHPWRGHPATRFLSWVLALAVVALGLSYLGTSPFATAVVVAVGAFLLYLSWARATGRAGDATITLTPEGIHQLYAGSEVFIPWDDVCGLVTTPTDLIVETTEPVVPAHHMPPFLGRRTIVAAGAVSLPTRSLAPLPYPEMIELYSTSEPARDELGTDEVVQRTRAALADLLRQSPPAALRVDGRRSLRWLVELVGQVVGWAMLAIGGGSLYLLVTTGSAPAIDSAPLALAVVLGSAALIWLTRRSLYARQYRGY
jgi:hypothetical protein